jgi:hypothetical protein
MRCKQGEHTKSQEDHALGKVLQTIYDLKAEVGCLRKALDRHGIQIDGESNPKHGKGNQFEETETEIRRHCQEEIKDG